MSCPDCFRGGKAVGEPQGSMSTIHGLPTYVAGSPSRSTSTSTIIFYTDAFGLALLNNKLLADDYANATGFRVLVPDIIPGGPMSPDVMQFFDKVMVPVTWYNIPGQISRAVNLFRALSYAIPFLYRASPQKDVCFKPSLDYARKVKAELPPGAKLGVAGFCWGGYQSINLSSLPAVDGGTERLIDAEFCAHPSRLKLPDDVVEAVTKFKTPISIAHAGNDMSLPTKHIVETEAALRQKAGTGDGENGYHYQIKHYEGCAHGFAVRARPENTTDENGADEAKEQAITWFKRWL